jgi:hypothetical protein
MQHEGPAFEEPTINIDVRKMSWTALHPAGSFAGQCGEENTMTEVAVKGVDLASPHQKPDRWQHPTR